ncbi:uncharacterized protein LOC125200297 [Salvia hispanica]|uniref:uncharacterized protein LOC125200297 n=1 Tax=Salvia hispanica TaxID=49212 RepID=UPI002009156B|nr:uncharacterized protein LOC125200297 [Salvia hispanica]
MTKIENDTNLQVTFSRRPRGIFKKRAAGVLCGAEYAVVVYSRAKPHSFATLASKLSPPGSSRLMGVAVGRRQARHYSRQEGHGPPGGGRNQRNRRWSLRRRRWSRRSSGGGSSTPCLRCWQMENLSYEQLEQLRNSVLMYKQGVQAKFSGGGVVMRRCMDRMCSIRRWGTTMEVPTTPPLEASTLIMGDFPAALTLTLTALKAGLIMEDFPEALTVALTVLREAQIMEDFPATIITATLGIS